MLKDEKYSQAIEVARLSHCMTRAASILRRIADAQPSVIVARGSKVPEGGSLPTPIKKQSPFKLDRAIDSGAHPP